MDLQNDIELEVAVANSRKAKLWKNQKLSWSAILDRMANTTRTPETVAEYRKYGKERQSEIKDVGGFVGGYCENGKRTQVRSRSVLALDADFADPGLWDDWCLSYGNAAAIYSTHKHTPEKPRLRLVVPLSRSVSPDEFQAIGRKVAQDLGIEQFDDTTYQPQRLMYWPSTSFDGDYVFKYIDAAVLDADAVLATYRDWRDISAWPMSSRVSDIIRKSEQKQQDPLTKDGLIGAFCRAYSIEEAIAEFVPVYEPCGDGRYTFTEGSTAAGVTTYDGKFSFSFHATDPASGVLCNAWDLVRLHKFSALDSDCDPGTAPGKRPSWAAMVRLAQEDDAVKRVIVADRVADFDDASGDADWEKQLKVTKDGSLASTIENIVLILSNDAELAGCLVYDEFLHNITTVAAVPWRVEPGAWTDSDDSALRYYLERRYGLSGKDKIFDAVNVVAMENKVHPVREYLEGLPLWDHVPRVETLLVDYLGAVDSEYVRTVTRKTLAAAVARIFRPGCKFDYMLTLQGRQGIGKSSLFRKLGGAWYSDSFSTIQGKEAYEQTLGVWIVEVGELAGMRKAETEIIKQYISKQVDRFRPAYGRRTQDFPRQCIFLGTTNESQFLRDSTGNRRFWVVDTPNAPRLSIWDDLSQDVIDQIWAEAAHLFRTGETLYLSRELEEQARKIQESYEEENPRLGMVSDYLERMLPGDWEGRDLYSRRLWLEGSEQGSARRDYVCTVEVLAEALGCSPEKADRYQIKEVNDILCRLPGWRRVEGGKRRTFGPYGRQRYFERSEI